MKNNNNAITGAVFLIAVLSIGIAEGAIVTVCSSGCDSTTVQNGINIASNYDEVRITDTREYNEAIIVNRSVILTSNSSTKPLVFSDTTQPPINITTDNVTMRNLTIKYNGTSTNFGSVTALSRLNITITNNTIDNTGSGTGYGVFLLATNYSTASNNTVSTSGGSTNYGVFLQSTSGNTISKNGITTGGTNNNFGIHLLTSTGNAIINNTLSTSGSSNQNFGIWLSSSTNNTANYNVISTSGTTLNYGMYLSSSTNNTYSYNTVSTSGTSSNYGIYIFSSSTNNIVTYNSITTNGTSSSNYGILLAVSSNTLSYNTISTNGTSSNHGIFISSSYTTLSGNAFAASGTNDNYGIYFQPGADHNIFSSNSISTNTAQNYGVYIDASNNNTFYDGRINATQAYDVFLAGTSAGQNNYFVNVSFNKSDVNATVADVKTKLFVKYRLDITARDQSSNALNGALVFGNDTDAQPNSANPTSNFSVTTNSTGQIPTQILTEFMANGTFQPPVSGYLYFTNYTVNASKSGYNTSSVSLNLTSDMSINLTLQNVNATGPADPVITVCASGCNSTGVQEAINKAENGYEVRITDSRTYNESVIVNKSIILNSNSTTKPTVFSDLSQPPMNITTDNVIVRNLAIKYNGTANYVSSIYATDRLNLTISNNTVLAFGSGPDYGIYLVRTNGSAIDNNTIFTNISGYNYGIYLQWSNSTRIKSNNINTNGASSNNYGIYIYYSIQGNIDSNVIRTNGTDVNDGVYLYNSSSSTVSNNDIYVNGTGGGNRGVHLYFSHSSNLTSNVISTNGAVTFSDDFGIYFEASSSNNISQNSIRTNGISGNAGIYLAANSSYSSVTYNNISTGGTSARNYGIHIESSSNTIVYNNISTVGDTQNYGIYLYPNSSSNTISFNNISTSGTAGYNTGINLNTGSNNTLASNIVLTNGVDCCNYGIYVSSGYNNTLASNNVSTGGTFFNVGIYLSAVSSSKITSNTVSTGGTSSNIGLRLDASSNNTLTSNNVSTGGTDCCNHGVYVSSGSNSNNFTANTVKASGTLGGSIGVWLDTSYNSTLASSVITSPATPGLVISGATVTDWLHSIDESNTVNGKPVKYVKNTQGLVISDNASLSSIIIANSSNMTLRNLTLGKDGIIELGFTNNSLVLSSRLNTSNASYLGAVYLSSSLANNVSFNDIRTSGSYSYDYGIYLNSSADNIVSSNNVSTDGTTDNYGVYLAFSSGSNNISSNTVSTNGTSSNIGIYILNSVQNSVSSNNVSTFGNGCCNDGIYIGSGYGNNLNSNYIRTGGENTFNTGIRLAASTSNAIYANSIQTGGTDSNYGIYLSVISNSNNVTYNTIATNGIDCCNTGIYIESSSSNNLTSNSVSTNGTNDNYGIYIVSNSSSNTFRNVSVMTDTIASYGLYLDTSNNNTFYDGRINATQAYDVFLAGAGGNNYFVNVSFNKTDVNATASNVRTKLFVQYRLDATARDQSSNALNNALVWGNDSSVPNTENPTSNFSTITNSSGKILTQILTEFMANGTFQPTVSGYRYFTNYTINASLAGYNPASLEVNMTESKSVSLTLEQQNVCNENTGACYVTVQKAINLANNYDRLVIANAKEYNESVVLNKTGLTLTSNTTTKPVVFSDTSQPTINITTYNVTIRNLTVKYNGTVSEVDAVTVLYRKNVTISNNTLINTGGDAGYGIFFLSTNFSTIANNTISTAGGNYKEGIDISSGSNNTVAYNSIYTGGNDTNIGISISSFSAYNTIISNTITTNGNQYNDGIDIGASTNNIVSYNTITTNGTTQSYGIALFPSAASNTISFNSITTNGTASGNVGIFIWSGSYNAFLSNNVTTNGTNSSYGIYLIGISSNNSFSNMIVTTGTPLSYGVAFGENGGQFFYDSVINATQAFDVFLFAPGGAAENNTYFVNVSFNKTDIGAIAPDAQKRLFVQHRVDVLTSPTGASVTGNDNTNVSDGENPASYFSATSNSSGNIPTQILTEFLANGTFNSSSGYLYFNNYTITASKSGYVTKAIQVNLTQSINLSISLDAETPATTTTTSGGGGSGGGGGTAATTTTTTTLRSEPKEKIIVPIEEVVPVEVPANLPVVKVPEHVPNKIIKASAEILELKKEESAIIDIKNTDMAVRRAEIQYSEDVHDVKVTVRQLVFRPEEVEEPKTDVYRYIEINSSSEKVKSAKISFDVEEGWLAGREDDVRLNHFKDGWKELPTKRIGKDGKRVKYEAETDDFSVFVISIAIPVTGEAPNENAAPSVQKPEGFQYGQLVMAILLVLAAISFIKLRHVKIKVGSKKMEVRISSVLRDPGSFDGARIVVQDCVINSYKQTGDGWVSTINDGSGTMGAVSDKRIDGKSALEGIVAIASSGEPVLRVKHGKTKG